MFGGIAAELEADQVVAPSGNAKWSRSVIDKILSKQEYMGLKSGYQTKIDNLNQRATLLTQLLNDEKIHKTKTLESVHILNVLADTMVLTQEHIDRFVEKVVVFRDGKIHVDFCNSHEISAEL
ncbi:MAG: hypothetical protein RR131_07865 [Anaerovorax sp.]